MSEIRLSKNLLSAADHVCTNAYINDLKAATKDSLIACEALGRIKIEDVYEIGVTDTLLRLQRNARALHYLLSMAADVAGSMKAEVHDIFVARDNYAKEALNKKKEALEAEERYALNKKKNEKNRNKDPE